MLAALVFGQISGHPGLQETDFLKSDTRPRLTASSKPVFPSSRLALGCFQTRREFTQDLVGEPVPRERGTGSPTLWWDESQPDEKNDQITFPKSVPKTEFILGVAFCGPPVEAQPADIKNVPQRSQSASSDQKSNRKSY